MPELARFFGIIICMYAEVGMPHHRPHFHAYFQNQSAVFSIDEIELIGGIIQQRQRRLIEAWAELHQHELIENWERLQSGELPFKIAPLR
jgi:hypothetical protein